MTLKMLRLKLAPFLLFTVKPERTLNSNAADNNHGRRNAKLNDKQHECPKTRIFARLYAVCTLKFYPRDRERQSAPLAGFNRWTREPNSLQLIW